ncbi:MAG: glycosyltransferase [Gammaproteobacteria bacterium]|nr:glycosyltransferase [Gammaproteobacteria bacterium]MDH3411648.1 glycosyltransferase [Gammaproteobacteria bacterium]
MRVAFLNPQGNFDPADSYWTAHPDFGGQLVYVKEVALALAELGVPVDIVTRRIRDPKWPEFSGDIDHYEGFEASPRILRIPCGGDAFLNKEMLWPCMPEFIDNLIRYYGRSLPDFLTAHYADGGYCGVLMQDKTGLGFTFTGHSLGAQKMDKLGVNPDNADQMEKTFRFSKRIHAERLSMERASTIITSTGQERMEQYSHPLYAGAVDVHDDTRFAVIPPGVNTKVFTTEQKPRDRVVEEKLLGRAAANPQPYIIVSSRLDHKKNIAGVVNAYVSNNVLQQRARLAIVIRGVDDPYQQLSTLPQSEQEVLRPILEAIAAAQLKDNVDFLNLKSQLELAGAYRILAQRGSVFALTSFYEPFGLAPIEAAACGLAVVATKNGGPSEIFLDKVGVLVDPADSEDIARGLLEALGHYEDYAERGRRRVAEKYTWRATAGGYLKVINRGIKQKRGAGQSVPELNCAERISAYLKAP